MGESPKPMVHTITTHKSRGKRRFARIEDAALIKVLKGAGKLLAAKARAETGVEGKLAGIYALPTNNIMELYFTRDKEPIAFVFSNLDVWLTFTADDLLRD